jgi:hypothetical protein
MTERKLSPEQIEELHEYCYFRSVIHYDVQVEIVDHLASSIEKVWETKPELPFDEAMYMVGEQFGGDLGFETIKKEKEKALRKKYWHLLWKFAGEYYKFPKIMITLMLTLIIYTAIYFSENDQWIIVSLVVLSFASSLYYRHYYFPKFIKIKTTKEYSFLLTKISLDGLLSLPMGFAGLIAVIVQQKFHFSTIVGIVFSVFISLYTVLLYGDYFIISKKIREHFEEQFPQFIKS